MDGSSKPKTIDTVAGLVPYMPPLMITRAVSPLDPVGVVVDAVTTPPANPVTSPLAPVFRPGEHGTYDPIQNLLYVIGYAYSHVLPADPVPVRPVLLPGPVTVQNEIIQARQALREEATRYYYVQSALGAYNFFAAFATAEERFRFGSDPLSFRLENEIAYAEERLANATDRLRDALASTGRLSEQQRARLELRPVQTAAGLLEILARIEQLRVEQRVASGTNILQEKALELKINYSKQELAEQSEKYNAQGPIQLADLTEQVAIEFFLPRNQAEAEIIEALRSATPEEAQRIRERYADLFSLIQDQVLPIDP